MWNECPSLLVGLRRGAERVPHRPTHVGWRGSGLQVFGIRALTVQGRNMDRNTLGEDSAELSFPVGKIDYKRGQEVWVPAGGWTDGFSDTWFGRAALCWL